MELIVNNKYQEVYQYDVGLVILINKFEKKRFPGINSPVIIDPLFSDSSQLENCQSKGVRVLINDYYNKEHHLVIEAGTVFYKNEPIVPTQDRSKWEIQIRNPATYLRGNPEKINKQLTEMLNFINEQCKKE